MISINYGKKLSQASTQESDVKQEKYFIWKIIFSKKNSLKPVHENLMGKGEAISSEQLHPIRSMYKKSFNVMHTQMKFTNSLLSYNCKSYKYEHCCNKIL